MKNRKTLNQADELKLDQNLAKLDAVRDLVQALPEDMPSLQWRSDLNAKLEAIAATPAKRSFAWWKLAAPMGLAASLATAYFVVGLGAKPATGQEAGSIEASLVLAHQESDARSQVSYVLDSAPAAADSTLDGSSWGVNDLEAF
ncbi:MAG: hypothetical protein JNM85_05985 [Chthonomonas sp.]|nr:hypothetical protein [Chthonomonas sp.]